MIKRDNRNAYIAALIGLNFLWTGIAYIAQAYRMLAFLDGGSVNLITCGAIGAISGLTITRLATDVPQQRRGLVFGAAYAFGSVERGSYRFP